MLCFVNNIYETMCSCTYTRQCTAACRTRWFEWLVLVIVRVRLQALLLLGDPGNAKELDIRKPLSPLRMVRQEKKLLSLAMSSI